MAETKTDRPEWTSFHRLVQELISGVVRRHTFTQWELELLLDLQTSCLRKASRPVVLRKYARAVQQRFVEGGAEPPRFSQFVTGDRPQTAAAGGFK